MCYEIADQVAEYEERDGPGGILESVAYAEEAEVEEEDAEFVAEEGEEVEVGGGVVPLMVDVSMGWGEGVLSGGLFTFLYVARSSGHRSAVCHPKP